MYTPSLPNAIMLKIHEIKSFFTAPSKVHDVTEVIAVCQNNGLKFGKNMQTISYLLFWSLHSDLNLAASCLVFCIEKYFRNIFAVFVAWWKYLLVAHQLMNIWKSRIDGKIFPNWCLNSLFQIMEWLRLRSGLWSGLRSSLRSEFFFKRIFFIAFEVYYLISFFFSIFSPLWRGY